MVTGGGGGGMLTGIRYTWMCHPTGSKVVQIIKCTCTVFIDNFRNISTNSWIYVSVCRESYGGYVKHERNDPMCDPWDS